MYKLVFFVPEDQAEQVKEAVFAAGAGRYELYDRCAWQTAGTGQFRPLEGSDPHIGSTGTLETVRELRVETICRDEVVRASIEALIATHPYEEPAYEVYRVWMLSDLHTSGAGNPPGRGDR